MDALARMAARRPVAMAVLAAAVAILGWISWRGLSRDLLPDVHSPTIVVSVRSGDRPPVEMERLYGEAVEQRLFAVRGIREITQVARTGRLVATVSFEWDADMDLALVDVQKAISPISGDPEVDEVLVRRFDPRQAPVLSVGLIAPAGRPDLAELRRVARRQIAPALERLPGIAEVRVLGGREREVRVLVDQYLLDAHGLSLAEVEQRVRAANVDLSAGTLEEGPDVYLVRGLSRYRSPEDVAAAVVRYERDAEGRLVAVRVADLAEVSEQDKEVTHLVLVDGREGVGLSIYKEAGANTVEVSRAAREALKGIGADLPGVEVRVISDEATLVEDSLGELQSAVIVGVLLTVAMLVVFLRSAGPTLIIATAVPVSLLATTLFMGLAEQSLNLMTLAGLALGAGNFVDNSIVVVESIFRRLQRGEPVLEAAAGGTAEVGGAIASSTLTTCIVFLPVIFVQGLAARLVEGLAFAVVVSMLAALAVAVLLIPALARWLLPRHGARALDPGIGVTESAVRWLLRRPLTVVLVSALAVALGLLWISRLGTELLPPADPRQFVVRLVGPAGWRAATTARAAAAIEGVLREAAGGGVEAVMAEVGRVPEDDRLITEENNEENTARLVVRLAPGGRDARELVAAAAPAVAQIPGLETSWEVGVSALARALGTSGPPISVEISGPSLEALRRGARGVQEELARLPELWNVRSSLEGGPPELRVELDRALAGAAGVDLDTLAAPLEAALDGRRVTVVTTGDEEKDVVLRTRAVRREDLLKVPLAMPGGGRLALGDIARLVPEEGAREIYRRDQRRVARVNARIAPGADFPAASRAVRAALAQTELPAGLRARLVGEEEERDRTIRQLALAAGLALLLVFFVLAGTFESLVHPLTVLSAVPLALLGVALALGPLGQPIGVMAMLGLIVLVGVAVNDAILLVDAAQRFRAEGLPRDEALVRAAGTRLRPILMTSLTTILALLPLAFGGTDAARLRMPLALTVIGGMVTSTIGSLLVTPCLYKVLDRRRRET
ncbi:MAG: efflux RND transporter permease subunit [Acidobacteria bacterium]|nr:efflux RND transporter permease subunit [Acidobacteriota bacterium]